jgi:predicted ATPase
MKIKSLSYHNKELNWELEPTEFGRLNLLVGASGVGKTRTLEAILDLQRIAKGKALSGVAWDVKFSVDGEDYRWRGEFEKKGKDANFSHIFSGQELEQNNENKPKILYENLSSSQDSIVERQDSEIKFQGERVPVKLSAFKSAMNLFNEEEVVAPIHGAFTKRIVLSKQKRAEARFFVHEIPQQMNLGNIREINLDMIIKLALAHQNAVDVFEDIKRDFMDIFPNVEDVTVTLHLVRDIPAELPEELSQGKLFEVKLSIKEVGVKNWIHDYYLSAGMLKTLLFIAEMYLAAEGTVVLIDEFENGLGINCIDVLNDLLLEDRELQYIMTSHHPYIINNVPMDYWKLVTRKGSTVKVRRAEEFQLGKSKHEAFMQLIQLEEFAEGITIE